MNVSNFTVSRVIAAIGEQVEVSFILTMGSGESCTGIEVYQGLEREYSENGFYSHSRLIYTESANVSSGKSRNCSFSFTQSNAPGTTFERGEAAGFEIIAVYSEGTRGAVVRNEMILLDARYNPEITAFSVERCDDAGEADDEGTRVMINIAAKTAQAADTSVMTMTIYSKLRTALSYGTGVNIPVSSALDGIENDNTYLTGVYQVGSAYDFKLSFGDEWEQAISNYSVGKAFANMHLGGSGEGVAFGQFCSGTGMFEVNYPAKFYQGATGYANIVYDTGRIDYTQANSQELIKAEYTVPSDESGMYMIIANVQFPTGSGGTFRFCAIKYTRGSDTENEIAAQTCPPQTYAGPRLCAVGLYNAQGGDTIRLKMNQNSGGSVSGKMQFTVIRV